MKGFSAILILLLLAGVATGVFLGVKLLNPAQLVQTTQSPLSPTKALPAKAQTSSLQHYNKLGIQFDYPAGYKIVEDSEKQFSERENANYRKNFEGYVGYAPAEVIYAFSVLPEGATLGSQFEIVPLTVWVFENPNSLSPEKFYAKNWYYPFIWGEFSSAQKNAIAPSPQGAIVASQPGAPKFQLYVQGDTMIMVRTVTEGEGSEVSKKILSSFKVIP